MKSITSADAQNPPQPPSPRLNLILHGLMAFLAVSEQGYEYYDILIPKPILDGTPFENEIREHEAWYGSPRGHDVPCPDPRKCGLRELGRETAQGPALYLLVGVDPPGKPGKPASANAIILNKGRLTVQYNMVRTVIRVPKPDIIRHYRGAEVPKGLYDGQDEKILPSPPSVVHEITVFSYLSSKLEVPRLIGFNDSYVIPEFTNEVEGQFWNLCIYSQPRDECKQVDDDLFNAMFLLIDDSGNTTSQNPGIKLSMFESYDDGPLLSTGSNVGIETVEMLTLAELCGHHPHPAETKGLWAVTAAPGGCGNGFICPQGSFM